jgi:ABC-type dipeptide/oligopeptide/nickel transport system permease subunit
MTTIIITLIIGIAAGYFGKDQINNIISKFKK